MKNFIFVFALVCIVDSFSSTCLCLPNLFKPNCGRNGRTYFNNCFRRCDQVKLDHHGRCTKCKCPNIVSPVCAEDGNTYVNSCEANCKKVLVVKDGMCDKISTATGEKMKCKCQNVYDPVCGENGETY